MGIASHIGRDGGQRHGESDRLRIDKPEADQPSPGVGARQKGHAGCGDSADNVGYSCSEEAGCTEKVTLVSSLGWTKSTKIVKFLTVWHIKNDCSSNEECDNLDSVSDRFKLSGHSGPEAQITNDDGREGVDNTVGDGPARWDS